MTSISIFTGTAFQCSKLIYDLAASFTLALLIWLNGRAGAVFGEGAFAGASEGACEVEILDPERNITCRSTFICRVTLESAKSVTMKATKCVRVGECKC